MDVTHCTDEVRWYLYMLFVHDEHDCRNRVAHLLYGRQDSDIVAKGLKQV